MHLVNFFSEEKTFKIKNRKKLRLLLKKVCKYEKVNLGYMKQNVCMVGIASGLSLGALGYTHCCIEDIGVLRSIPGITIISPSDAFETVKAIEASLKSINPFPSASSIL